MVMSKTLRMRITPGPGTVVVIVHRNGEANVPRVGRMTGRAGAISAEMRPDLPPLTPNAFVVLLAKVANQKMMAEGTYAGEKDGSDSFTITRGWVPSDNRRDPRLPVRVKCEVRPRGSRGTISAVICDLSAGGAKIEVESDSLRGEIELLVRYGGFSATLPAFVLGYEDEELEDETESSDEGATDESEAAAAEEDVASDDEAGVTEAAADNEEAGASTDEEPAAEAPADDATEPAAEDATSSELEAAPESEPAPVENAPAPLRNRRRPEKIVQPVVEVRLMFDDLDLPQQGFLRHMLRDVAEISGWELAS